MDITRILRETYTKYKYDPIVNLLKSVKNNYYRCFPVTGTGNFVRKFAEPSKRTEQKRERRRPLHVAETATGEASIRAG